MPARASVRLAFPALAVALVTAGFFAWLGFEVGGAHTTLVFNDLAQIVSPAIAAALCFVAARRAVERGARASWTLLGCTAMSWGIGQVVWTWYEVVLGQETPFPGFADIGYLG